METLGEGFVAGLGLILTGDPALLEISLRSLFVSLSAVVLASLFAFPLAAWLTVSRFRARRGVIALLNALMGLPPVVVGLFVYLMLSRAGPFGVLGLLYTPWAMILAQALILLPLIASIAHQGLREVWSDYRDLLISLGASKRQRMTTLLMDGRRGLLTAALAGFGRGIGEVGAVMIVGGNIENATRVLTTAIALETGKGEFEFALSLGLVLLAAALCVNMLLYGLGYSKRGGRGQK